MSASHNTYTKEYLVRKIDNADCHVILCVMDYGKEISAYKNTGFHYKIEPERFPRERNPTIQVHAYVNTRAYDIEDRTWHDNTCVPVVCMLNAINTITSSHKQNGNDEIYNEYNRMNDLFRMNWEDLQKNIIRKATEWCLLHIYEYDEREFQENLSSLVSCITNLTDTLLNACVGFNSK